MVILRSHRDTETEYMVQQPDDNPDLAGFQFYRFMSYGMSWTKLVLPDKFASELNGRELWDVRLRVAGEGPRAWDAEVVVDEHGDTFLGRGWEEFARANDLEPGQLLVFRYDGAALLTVTVFDDSECVRRRQSEEVDYADGTAEESQPSAVPGRGSSSSRSNDGGGGGTAPWQFTVTLRQCHLGTKQQQYLNVPTEFSDAHGYGERSRVVLQMRRQRWTVNLKHGKRGRGNETTRTAFRYGWNRFCVDNGLGVGDTCFFTLRDQDQEGGAEDDQVLNVEVRKQDGAILR